MQELIRLHKIFCLAQHPLWLQIASRFWKKFNKTWNPDIQVVNKEQWDPVLKEVSNKLLRSDLLTGGNGYIDEKYLIDLMGYYSIDHFYSNTSLDRVAFNAVLAYTIVKFTPGLNIQSLCVIGICCLHSIESNTSIPSLSVLLPHQKEESDFLIWLYNNFTKISEIQDSIATYIESFFPDFIFKFNDRIPETKRVLLNCRETFSRLLKLKNSEFRTKKILPIVKVPEKHVFRKQVFKSKFPIQGKSIKLQSPSLGKLGPVKVTLATEPAQSHLKDFQPGLLETLVEQYKNCSGCATPENLSPRIFKIVSDKKENAFDFREANGSQLGKSLEMRLSSRHDKRSASTKSIRRIKRYRLREAD